MAMNDPIANMLTRIRNAQNSEKASFVMPSSKLTIAIAQVLKGEGYIDSFQVRADGDKSELEIGLKYEGGRPVIGRIERVSRPGLRAKRRGSGGFRTGHPASDSTRLSADILNALSRALNKA